MKETNININMGDPVTRYEFERLANSVDNLRDELKDYNEGINRSIKELSNYMKEQNSKVFKLEKEQELYRAGRSESCPNMDTIKQLKKHYDYDQQRKNHVDRQLRNTQIYFAVIIAAITLINILVNYAT
jgi:hypothetical protein